MTVKESISTWSEAATVQKCGEGVFVRVGNWEATARALRHFNDAGDKVEEQADKLNGDALVLVTPAGFDPEAKAAPRNRAPFLLVVK